jgi:predicted dehydrogenase
MMARKSRIKVGVIGFGEIGRIHVRHLQGAGADIVGIVTRNPEINSVFPAYRSLNDLLPRVDALTIAVPNHLHASLCLEAIHAGKAVFVEKPLCLNPRELAQLETALCSARVPVKMGFRLRWNPCLRALRERLARPRRITCT